MEQKKSFPIYIDYKKHIEKLSFKERGVLFTAMLDYAESGALPGLSGKTEMAFSFIQSQMDRDAAKYEAKCNRNRRNGAKGGRPLKPKETEDNPEEPKKTERLFSEPKKPDTDTDTDTDTDIKDTTATSACEGENVFGIAMGYYMDKICSTPSTAMIPDMQRYAKTMSADVVKHAIDKALDAGAHNWNYINAVLSSWEKAGVKTMADAERENQKRGRSNCDGKGRGCKRGDNTEAGGDDGIDWDSLTPRL